MVRKAHGMGTAKRADDSTVRARRWLFIVGICLYPRAPDPAQVPPPRCPASDSGLYSERSALSSGCFQHRRNPDALVERADG